MKFRGRVVNAYEAKCFCLASSRESSVHLLNSPEEDTSRGYMEGEVFYALKRYRKEGNSKAQVMEKG